MQKEAHVETSMFNDSTYLRRDPMKKVLVIDDNPTIVELIKYAVNLQTSYNVVVAYDGVQGLERVYAEQPDCVIVDVASRKRKKMSAALHKEIREFLKTFKGSHLYVTCSAWRPQDGVVVSVRGSGDGSPKSSEERFVFSSQNGKATREY